MPDAMTAKSFARIARLCPAHPLGKPGNLVSALVFRRKTTFARIARATFQKVPGQAKKTPLLSRLPDCPALPPLKRDCRGRAMPRTVPRGATLRGNNRHAGALEFNGRRSTFRTTTRERARVWRRNVSSSTITRACAKDRLPVEHYAHARAKPGIVKATITRTRARPWLRCIAHRRTPNAIAANCARLGERERARSGSPCPAPSIASAATLGPPMTFEATRNNQKQARGSR